MNPVPRQTRRSAFTMIELLVVIAIIGVLASLLMVAVQRARESAHRLACKNNLHQIGLAMHLHHDGRGSFPAGYLARDDSSDAPGWGWAVQLLPYLEQANLKKRIKMGLEISDPTNATACAQSLPIFRCPSDVGPLKFTVSGSSVDVGFSNYVGMFGTPEITDDPSAGNGIFFRNSHVRTQDIIDGLSHTIMVGERSSNLALSTWVGAVPGGQVPPIMASPLGPEGPGVLVLGHTGAAAEGHTPNNPTNHVDDFFSLHPLGVNFLFADGSVQIINNTIDPIIYEALGTRAGAEIVGGY